MTKIELEEIFKIIDTEIAIAHKELTEAVTAIDQYHFIGKKKALNDVKDKIKLHHKHLLEAQE